MELLSNPRFLWAAFAAYWVFSAAVNALDEPTATDGRGYRFVYKFVHTIAGNLTTAFGSKIPGIKENS